MKEIRLTQGYLTLVDDEDFEYLSQWKWYAIRTGRNMYATRNESSLQKKTIYMHREIIGNIENGFGVDHIDHNSLNNQRSNLRVASRAENLRNSRSGIGSSSKYIGVSFYKMYRKWRAQIMVNGKNKHIGYFESEIDAAKARDKSAIIHHKDFANLNFPIEK